MNYLPLGHCAHLAMMAPIVFAALWILSAAIDGEWTFGVDSLSRMGISEDPLSAALFNGGCMAVGFMGFLFGMGIAYHERGTNLFAGILYSIGMVFLMLVGVFPMDQPDIHYVVACTFAAFVLFSIMVTMVTDYINKWHPEIDAVCLALTAVLILTQPFPLWEALLVIMALLWTFLQGYKMLRNAEQFPLRTF